MSAHHGTNTGDLLVQSCRVWQQNANHKNACTDLASAGTGSKCDCDPIVLHVDHTVPLAELRAVAMKVQGGGVGYYPSSGSPFVHVDTGSVRAWPRMSREQLIASCMLLLNAGHEASVNVFGNGLVAMLSRGLAPVPGRVPECVEEMLRFDSALQLFERTATADVRIGDVTVEEGQKIAALLGAANRDPAVFGDPDTFLPTRDPNPHLAFGAGVHFCLGAPLARMELAESLGLLWSRMPGLHLAADPTPRGTFVLRGYTAVPVADHPNRTRSREVHP